jgi:hypothetical protein
MLLAAAALRRKRRGFSSRPPRRHHAPAPPPPHRPVPPPPPQPQQPRPQPLPPGVLRGVTDAMMKLAVAGTEQASAALGRADADAAAQFWPSGVPRSLPPWVSARLHWAPEGEKIGWRREREREEESKKEKEHHQSRILFSFLFDPPPHPSSPLTPSLSKPHPPLHHHLTPPQPGPLARRAGCQRNGQPAPRSRCGWRSSTHCGRRRPERRSSGWVPRSSRGRFPRRGRPQRWPCPRGLRPGRWR